MKKNLLVFILTFSLISSALAQLAMTRTTFNGTFTPITSGAGGGTLSTATGDDAIQTGIPIGFTFNYLGSNFTTIDFNTNGVAAFTGSGLTNVVRDNGTLFTNISNGLLGPWFDDLASDSIVFRTTGVLGSQVFTIQWNAKSYYTGSTQLIQFQLKLYEGTNVIEFHYGAVTSGTVSASESASIGIENTTGGAGNYLDAVTGSAFCGHGFMSSTTKWPTRYYRFTPGIPTALSGGTYNVGVGQTYPTIDEAVADVNHRGISGPVVLSLVDATYDVTPAGGDNIFPVFFGPIAGISAINTVTLQPSSGTRNLIYEGSAGGFGANQSSTLAYGAANEPIIGLVGSRYIRINNLNLSCSATGIVDRGISLINGSGTVGSQFNMINNVNVTLSRINIPSVGFETRIPTTPTSVLGTNSDNSLMNFNISNCYAGINFAGNATFPDLRNVIGNTVATNFNTIGSTTANDIGNGTANTYGITMTNQGDFSVYNNLIQNVTGTGTFVIDGIVATGVSGTSNIYRNKIINIRNTSTTGTVNITGIRSNVTTGTNTVRIYNNFISGLTSGYTGVTSATRQIKGIFVQTGGGGSTTQSLLIDNNTVSIDGTASPNISSTCFEIGGVANTMNVRNNIFVNNTGAQTAPASHYTWVSTNATAIGGAGSISNFNDLYIVNTTQGFVGRGGATDYATLANWQAAMVGQEANSISSDPGFTNVVTDLHVSAPGVNNSATPVAWITTDIDNDARSATTPDMGADEFVPLLLDAGVTLLVNPASGTCYSATQSVTARIRNFAVVPLDFSVNPVTVTVNVTGAITTTLTYNIIDNSLNGGSPLAVGTTLDIPMGTINMSGTGTYTFNGSTTLTGDGNAANNAMTAVNITVNYGTAASTPRSICDLSGNTITLGLTGQSSGFTIQWEQSTNAGGTWSPIAGGTTASYNVGTITDTVWYRANICGSVGFSNVDTNFVIPITAPTTIGDTVCGVDTLHLQASGLGTLNWYTDSTSTSLIYSGTNYNVVLPSTDTLWVSNISSGGISFTGKPDNTGGGGQQTSTAYNIFDVFQNCTLQGVTVYPGAVGTALLELRNSAGALITSATLTVTSGDVGNPTYFPLNFNLTPGTGYRLAQGTPSVSMFRNSGGVTYPYTLPGYLNIYSSSAGTTFYYFGYNWQVSTGCPSPRTPVIGVVQTPPAMSITNPINTICENDTTPLIISSVDPTYTYTWSPSVGLSTDTTTATTINAYPTISTRYIVQAINSAGCRLLDTAQINVNTAPMGTLSILDSVICIGQTNSITFNTFETFFTDSTVVNILDNATDTAFLNVSNQITSMMINSIDSVCLNITHTWDSDVSISLVSPSGTVVDLSSNNGGSGDNYIQTCFKMSAATNITTGAAPFTGTYIPEGNFAAFTGDNANGNWMLVLNDNASGDPGTLNNWSIYFRDRVYEYSWTGPSGPLTDTTDSINISPIVTGNYSLLVTDTVTGCTRTFSVTAAVYDSLNVSIIGNTLLCPGDSTLLIADVTGGDGNYDYLWYDFTTNDSIMFTVPFSFGAYVQVTDGCTTPTVYDTLDIAFALPLDVTLANDTVCEGTSHDFVPVVTDGNLVYTYSWTPGGSTNDTLNIVNPTTTTTYTVTVTDGCGFTDMTSATLEVLPLAIASFTTSGSPADCNYTFTNTSTNGTTYNWNFGDGNNSTSMSPTHTYASGGSYTVTLVATNSCGSDTINNTITCTVGLEHELWGGSLQVFPNPATDVVYINANVNDEQVIVAHIIDMNGKIVSSHNLIVNENVLNASMNVNSLSAGIYTIKLIGRTNQTQVKLVKK